MLFCPHTMPQKISEERLLAALQEETTRFTVDLRTGQAKEDPITDIYKEFAGAFERVITDFVREHGDVGQKDMGQLCDALTAAQEREAERLRERIPDRDLKRVTDRITASRGAIRKDLAMSMGWTSAAIRRKKQEITGINKMMEVLGQSGRLSLGTDYFSADEQRVCLWFLRYLNDEVAAADYMRAIFGKRFGRCREEIRNLRPHLGNIEVRGGNPFVDIPIPLLTLPEHGCLRELTFNKMRNMIFEEYYMPADKEEGVDRVLDYLARCRSETDERAREQFVDELIDYFLKLDTETTKPRRLVSSLDQNGEFPAKHQRVAMLEMKRHKRLLVADQTGAGKTGGFIAGVEKLREEGLVSRALVVCPTEVVPVWEKALSSKPGGCFRSDLPPEEQPKVTIIPTGKVEKRKQAWEDGKKAEYVVTTNVRLRKGKDQNFDPVALALELGADCLIVDEGHNFRNPKGKDTNNIFRISQGESLREGYVGIGTATPVYNTLRDLAALLRLLYTGKKGVPKHAGLNANVRFEDIQELARALAFNRKGAARNLLHLRMLRRDQAHCVPVEAELTREEPHFADLPDWERIEYDAHVEYPFKGGPEAVQMLSRFCSMSEAKYRQTLAQVLQYMQESRTGKVLCALSGLVEGITRYRGTNDPSEGNTDRYMFGRLREELLTHHNISTYIIDGSNTGSDPLTDDEGNLILDINNLFMTKTRQILDDFERDERKSLLVLLAETCGEGIAVTCCDRELWHSPTTVKPKELQMDGRIHRKGQRNPVSRRNLVLRDTIEEGKMHFADRKYDIITKVIDKGEALTQDEYDILVDDVRRVNEEGFLVYETLSPKQKILWIFNRLLSQGKERVRQFFSFDNGKYAKTLAEAYRETEDLAVAGNNRRLMLALLQKNLPEMRKTFRKKLNIADIACGTMAFAHSLHRERGIEVHSSDISGAMLEVGKRAYGKELPPGSIQECAMDELSYRPGSMHAAFLSLALQYTKHTPRANGRGGEERIMALTKLNSVLADGGKGYIALPRHVFDREDGTPDQERLERFYTVLEEYGGFRVIREESGRAQPAADAGDHFATYVVSLEKVGPSRLPFLPTELWTALVLDKKYESAAGNGIKKTKKPKKVKPPPEGAFYEHFILGSQRLSYQAPDHEEPQNQEHRLNKNKYARAMAAVRALIAQHGTIDNIPPEKLLSVSLDEISQGEQEERDERCRQLLKQYGGERKKIPIRTLAAISPIIFVPGKVKKGSFLCLANIADAKKHPTGGYGKRYFDDEEFST